MRSFRATCVAAAITLLLQASGFGGDVRAARPGDVTLAVYEIFPGDSIQDAVNRSPGQGQPGRRVRAAGNRPPRESDHLTQR